MVRLKGRQISKLTKNNYNQGVNAHAIEMSDFTASNAPSSDVMHPKNNTVFS